MTKKQYLERLRFFASFYFSKDACDDIILDYEDWFDNEIGLGRSEDELCEEMLSPRMLAKKMYFETENKDNRFCVLLKNITVKTVVVVIVHMLLCFYTLMKSNTRGESYLYYGLIINLIVYLTMFFMFFKDRRIEFTLPTNRLINFFLPVLFIFAFWLVTKNTSVHGMGLIYDLILMILMIAIYVYGILLAVINQNNTYSIVCLIFTFGFVVMIGFTRNQLHMFYPEFSEHTKIIWGNVFIYAEMLIFQVMFWVGRKKWMHN